MELYRVTINFNPISYELEAENEDKAVEYAQECFFDEKLHDIIGSADLEVQQMERSKQ
jgi:hypothetical protein